MSGIRVERFAEPSSFLLGLSSMRKRGITPRGLAFLALDPLGAVHVGIPNDLDDVVKMKVGEKLGLDWPVEGRFYHFDSVHRLRDGFYLFNGDRRLTHPGDATEVAALVTDFLKGATAANVFFGCTAHQPGSWLVGGRDRVALHESGFVEVVPVPAGLLARRIVDHRLWMLPFARLAETGRIDVWDPVFTSPLGNLLMLERRIIDHRLVLTCERGLVEVDVRALPSVGEVARVQTVGGFGVVGRVSGVGFAVTQGRPQPWGLDEIRPATLIGAADGSLALLGTALSELVTQRTEKAEKAE
jgi:hypothetical protein